MPSPIWNESPHPFLQHFSRGNSTPSELPCSCEVVIEQSKADTAPEAKCKPSCGRLTQVSIQIRFLNEDQETHGLPPLILSLQSRAQGAKACAVLHVCKALQPQTHSAPPAIPPIIQGCIESRFPSSQATPAPKGARSVFTPCPVAKYHLKVAATASGQSSKDPK